MSGQDEDRTDRSKHKIRIVGKQDGSKVSNPPRSDERLIKIETDMTKIATNMNRQYEELKRLIAENQPRQKTANNYTDLYTASDMPKTAFSDRKPDTHAFVSTGKVQYRRPCLRRLKLDIFHAGSADCQDTFDGIVR